MNALCSVLVSGAQMTSCSEMNLIFGRFMEFCILRASCEVSQGLHLLCKRPKVFMEWASLTLQETRSIHDSMNLQKIEFIAYYFFYK